MRPSHRRRTRARPHSHAPPLRDSDPVLIRVATPGDEAGLAEVHVLSWQGAYRGQIPDAYLDSLSITDRTERWASILAESGPTHASFVAVDDARIVGFANIGPSRDEDTGTDIGELLTIYLLPKRFGTGIGRALMERATEALRDAGFTTATLWVLESNARARRFYDAAGWSPDGATHLFEVGGEAIPELRYRRAL
jgi:GNAT superfamily N-acetyltransferase